MLPYIAYMDPMGKEVFISELNQEFLQDPTQPTPAILCWGWIKTQIISFFDTSFHTEYIPGLVNVHSLRTGKSPCEYRKINYKRTIFNSYVTIYQRVPCATMFGGL